jgi:hypothetical protein
MGAAAKGSAPAGGAGQVSVGKKNHFVTFVATLAAVGGFLFGFDTGVISGVVVLVKSQ